MGAPIIHHDLAPSRMPPERSRSHAAGLPGERNSKGATPRKKRLHGPARGLGGAFSRVLRVENLKTCQAKSARTGHFSWLLPRSAGPGTEHPAAQEIGVCPRFRRKVRRRKGLTRNRGLYPVLRARSRSRIASRGVPRDRRAIARAASGLAAAQSRSTASGVIGDPSRRAAHATGVRREKGACPLIRPLGRPLGPHLARRKNRELSPLSPPAWPPGSDLRPRGKLGAVPGFAER